MAEAKKPSKNIFQHIVGWLLEAAEWIEVNAGDPAIRNALIDDLALKPVGANTAPVLRQDSRDSLKKFSAADDPQRQVLLENVNQVVALIDSIKPFADAIKTDGMTAWDVIYLLGRVGLADSIRLRLPVVYAAAKLAMLVSDDPESMEAFDPAVVATLLRGDGLAPGAGDALVRRISDGTAFLIHAGDIVAEKFLGPNSFDAYYGWDPPPGSTSPKADLVSARTATFILRDPGSGITGALTVIGVPSEHGGPGLVLSTGGSLTLARAAGAISYEIEFGGAGLGVFVPLGSPQPFRTYSSTAGFLRVGARPTGPAASGKPALRIGSADSTRVDFGSVGAELTLGNDRAGFGLRVAESAIVIKLGEGDGFLQKLPVGEIRVAFALGVALDTELGLRFEGGTSLRVNLPINATAFGVFTVHYLELAVGGSPSSDQGLAADLAGGFSLHLGPFEATVDRVGLRGDVGKLKGGNFSRLGELFSFRPPDGIGLLLDAGIVKGGGYLFVDPQRGEYAGALELRIGPVSVKAIAVVTTRVQGGSGWALLLLVYGQFPPIQLSFGFTLTGLGGMIGLQHSADFQALQDGMRTGVLDDVLFPKNPVADAPRIIKRLRTVFPPTAGALIVGPMVELGWGTPSIVIARLGILVQIDNALGGGGKPLALSKIVLIGQLVIQLPPKATGKVAILKLQIDIVGSYDFAQQWLFVRARLRDSKVGGLDIAGELLVSARFGSDDSSFVLSAGGFHPKFKDLPAGIPAKLDRLSIGIDLKPVKLKIEAYFALTSNTVQFGASAELKADLGPIEIKGWLGFDALIELEPTVHFTIDLRFGAKGSFKGHTLMGVDVSMTLEGPGRWHAVGKGTFSILWWDKTISFDESWGTSPQLPVQTTNVAAALIAELRRPANWNAQLPAGGDSLVTIGKVTTTDVAAHPLGRVGFTQHTVPLGLELQRFGSARVEGPTRFDIKAGQIGDREIKDPTRIQESFARAQFVNMTEAQKLAAPSFERLPSGASFGSAGFTVSGQPRAGDMEFETIYLEPEDEPVPRPGPKRWRTRLGKPFTVSDAHVTWQLELGPAALSARNRAATLRAAKGRRIEVSEPELALADEATLQRAGGPLPELERFSPSLAEQTAARRPGARVLEAYELEPVG